MCVCGFERKLMLASSPSTAWKTPAKIVQATEMLSRLNDFAWMFQRLLPFSLIRDSRSVDLFTYPRPQKPQIAKWYIINNYSFVDFVFQIHSTGNVSPNKQCFDVNICRQHWGLRNYLNHWQMAKPRKIPNVNGGTNELKMKINRWRSC